MAGTAISPANLHLRRCARHTEREAVARCPSCLGYFCRECVVEHDGRLLCAACLTRLNRATELRRERWLAARRAGAAVAGLLVLWFSFQLVGNLLLKIPPQVHDGTFWKRMAEHSTP